MPLDRTALARCGGTLHTADQLCRCELERFKAALSTGSPVTVGCTQEAPLFSEVAEEAGAAERIRFVNVRETAGWSKDAAEAGPKMAALLAAAAEPPAAVQFARRGGPGRRGRPARWGARGPPSPTAGAGLGSGRGPAFPPTSTSPCS